MADVLVEIAGREYRLACRAGGEDALRDVARIVDERADTVRQAIGDTTEARLFLFTALMLADDLNDLRAALAAKNAPSAPLTEAEGLPAPPSSDTEANARLDEDQAAERIEHLNIRLEALAGQLRAATVPSA